MILQSKRGYQRARSHFRASCNDSLRMSLGHDPVQLEGLFSLHHATSVVK